MLREALLIMITLLTSCWSYSPSTNSYSAIRLRIDRSHSNKILTHRGKLCMSCNDDMLLQSLNYLRSIDDRQLSRPTRFVYIKKPVLASLASARKLLSALYRPSPSWAKSVVVKGRTLLLSVFISLSIALGRVKQADAQSTGVMKSTHQSNLKSSVSSQPRVSQKVANDMTPRLKKTVEVELNIAAPKLSDRKSFHTKNVVVASASSHHGTDSSAAKVSPVQRTVREDITQDKVKKNRKSGSVVLKEEAEKEVKQSLYGLADSMKGAKLDTLIMLMVTSAVIPVFKRMNLSPILGFLLMGTILGPSCLGSIHDVHTIDILGELGIVFFLFEMGLELSVARLNAMKRDVFGLGTSQFLVTAAVGSAVSIACGLPTAAAVTIGGSLALSSSAFVLQLLKDKDAMGTRHGKASFGILLLQDLAVVPLLVVVELLAKGGTGLGKALSIAAVKALFTLSVMGVAGKKLLNPIFYYVAKSKSHEAFLSIILTTVLLMSFVTQGIGLSNTLGAFLAGLLLAETKYKYQIEADIAPFRGLLLGFFFITVGFNIDLAMILKEAPKITAMLVSLIAGKAAIITALSLAFGMSFANSQLSGLLLAQGGEFAFVALGIAERSGLIAPQLCKMLLTTVALSMAATPMLAEAGSFISKKIEEERGLTHYLGQDSDALEMKSESNDFVLVAGYGRVGKMVCNMLDRLPVRYIALDSSPGKAIEARGKGLPVFYGDINRPEVLRNFDVGAARACVFAIDDMAAINKAVINVRKMYPNLPLLVKAKNGEHKRRLETMFDNIYVMSPVFQQDSVLLTLPFGGAVLRSLGMSQPEVEAILEDFRRMHIDEDNPFTDDTFKYLSTFGPKKITIPEKSVSDKKDKEVGRERDRDEKPEKHMKEGSWDGTEEQERQEEEQEMHEYSRINRILNERSLSKETAKKVNMNGMIGGVEETTVEPTDGPVSVYLDGSGAIDTVVDTKTSEVLTPTAPVPASVQGVEAGSGPAQ